LRVTVKAERLELADVGTDLLALVGLAGVVVGSEVVEAGGRVVQQVPDVHEDWSGRRRPGPWPCLGV
jgi:hypothetical protein